MATELAEVPKGASSLIKKLLQLQLMVGSWQDLIYME